jgi:IS605 OrfB family transposase
MWDSRLPIKKFMSSKKIDWMGDLGGIYKDMVYQQASQIIRSCRFKKGKKSKPIAKTFCINFDERSIEMELSNNSFDKWLKIRLPFIQPNRKRERIEVLIPLKDHQHSLKFKDWQQAKTIRLSKTYATLVFDKPDEGLKTEGTVIGLDSGYKNLVTSSTGQFIGKHFDETYGKIARKRQGSKAFKRALRERDQTINRIINQELDLSNIKEVRVEDLKDLKKGIAKNKRFRKEFRNKYQRWIYRQVLSKLARKCEENRVLFTSVPPAYTSQTCPRCRFKDHGNRKLEVFRCLNCGYENHADIVGAMNIASSEFNVPDTENVHLGELNG